jgi:hypothetical protein
VPDTKPWMGLSNGRESPRMRTDALWTTVIVLLSAAAATAATHRTPNFLVEAPTLEMAKQAGSVAENSRRQIAIKWLGHEMRPWYAQCRLLVDVGEMGAGGATSFTFDRGQSGTTEVFGWSMRVQGPFDRIIDSVIPHEVTHTILACHFRSPLPRWADEGVATSSEDDIEKRRQRRLATESLRSGRLIPLRRLLAIREYPNDMKAVLLLYAEGFSLTDYLLQESDNALFLAFVQDALQKGWDDAIRRHYRYKNVEDLEKQWHAWIQAGSPNRSPVKTELLADASQRTPTAPKANPVIRAQSPGPPNSPNRQRLRNPLWIASITERYDQARRTDSSIRAQSELPRGVGLHAPQPGQPQSVTSGPARQVVASPAHDQTMPNAQDNPIVRHAGWVSAPRTRLVQPMLSRPIRTTAN